MVTRTPLHLELIPSNQSDNMAEFGQYKNGKWCLHNLKFNDDSYKKELNRIHGNMRELYNYVKKRPENKNNFLVHSRRFFLTLVF